MTDEFDDLPIDEEADDFQNFNPDKYIRRRQATRGTSDFDDQRNLSTDLPSRGRGRRSYRDANDDIGSDRDYGRGRRRGAARRGRNSVDYDDEIDSGEAAGMGAGLIGMFTSLFGEGGENIGLLQQILPQLQPFGRWIVGLIGCIVVVLCGLACVGIFFIYSLFNTPR